jgi:ABC-2 type transport system permease protein
MTYLRLELLRTLRNARFFVFSLVFPVVLYLLLAGTAGHQADFGSSGISAQQYYMAGLVSFGTMAAVLAGGARIAAERQVGWNRQLRLTPLSVRTYLRTKVVSGYLLALISIVLLYVCGIAYGVRMPVDKWLQMTGLILVALIPFAILGIALGHLLTVDSMGPAMGGITALFAFLGGTWFPITGSGFLPTVAQALPAYWLVQAGRVGEGGDVWSSKGWTVIACWALACAFVAARAYRRDTRRV